MSYRPPLVEIETIAYGTVLLRASLLMRSVIDIGDPNGWEPREFTVKLVCELLDSPKLDIDEIRSWNDHVLKTVVQAWVDKNQDERWTLSGEVPFFAAVQESYKAYNDRIYYDLQKTMTESFGPILSSLDEMVQSHQATLNQRINQLNQSLQGLEDRFNQYVQSVLNPLQAHIESIIASMTIDIQWGTFFESLPDIAQLRQQFEDYDKALQVLAGSGYRFALHNWTLVDMDGFVGIDQVDPQIRNAVVTNKLLYLTRQPPFIQQLQYWFGVSSILKRRWHILEEALSAHHHRNYVLSIPTLLAQFEGLFTDALVLKGMVIRINGRLYAKDNTGNPKRDKKGKRLQLHGLGQKVHHADLRTEEVLHDMATFFVSRLVPDRNKIMHGSSITYAKAKLSLQLVLNIYILAAEFAHFEGSH